MGVGGHFWDLLKPYARREDPDFLRNKRVAVDLSFWIVQHDAAIRSRAPRARCPHLRTLFFRTIALFSKMGAFPVFIVDGEPTPLKAQARMERFFRGSGVELSAVAPATEGGEAPAKKRSQVFARYVRECVELLELLGMPVLEARCEAEALCAQLNSEGHVDACITADSDAFLFGAKCVIKCFQSNSKEPFECYYVSDIEAGLGLRRKQMVAMALLVGSDYDLGGVSGFGVDTAVRFIQLFTEDDILDRLSEIGKGIFPFLQENVNSMSDLHIPSPDDGLTTIRSPHCSHCGHPGNKKAHLKSACEYCMVYGSQTCIEKPSGFRCKCPSCDREQKFKQLEKQKNWQIKICKRIAEEHNFPNNEIVDMYLCGNHGNPIENDGTAIRWNKPDVGRLVDFLVFHQHWQPSYIRQRLLPMLSTIFFREMALNPSENLLLDDQYELHSILREKIRNGHAYYLVKWKKAGLDTSVGTHDISDEKPETLDSEPREVSESVDLLDEPDVPQVLVDDGCWYLLTDENMELVQAAFPEIVDQYLEDKRVKDLKSKQKKAGKSKLQATDKFETPKSNGIQLSITEFYRSTKPVVKAKSGDCLETSSSGKRQPKKSRTKSPDLDRPISKSAKRRLLF